jgi:DNA-directed RNA polymerase II subunit RPB11
MYDQYFCFTLIFRQLLNAPKVLYAGYRIPHPLVNYIELKIQTNGQTDPETEFSDALASLSKQTLALERGFQAEIDKHKLNKK